MAAASGMAASIRAATESETFDLAGNAPSTIKTTMESAFATPLVLSEMIRITFITGAGKLGRQRYDDNAAKTVTSTLRDLGYEEDRGASCVVECAGSFKSQHDTGKNLKTIVVFPKVTMNDGLEDGMNGLSVEDRGPSVLEENSAEQMIAVSSNTVFEKNIGSKCPSWSQKKACGVVISEIKEIMDSLDGKLLKGTVFTPSEQDFYDAVTVDSLEQKAAYIKQEMQKHVEAGKITRVEKGKLLTQVTEKIENLEKEIDTATKESKPKKVNKLTAQKGKLTERQKTLDGITPQPPHPLRHQAEIEKLRKEMQPLLKLENQTKGRLLTLKETTTLSRKYEIEEEITELEDKSRGWFEDDEDFQTRVEASRSQASKRAAAKKTVKKSSSSGRSAGAGSAKKTINWVVPGAKRVAKKPASKKSSRTANTFAAMMMDSDSDSD